MAQSLMLVYVLVTFLSLSFVVTTRSMSFFNTIFLIYLIYNITSSSDNILFNLFDNAANIRCVSDHDCPVPTLPIVIKCINNFCVLTRPGDEDEEIV